MSVWIISRFVVDDALSSVQKYHWTIASLFHIYFKLFHVLVFLNVLFIHLF